MGKVRQQMVILVISRPFCPSRLRGNGREFQTNWIGKHWHCDTRDAPVRRSRSRMSENLLVSRGRWCWLDGEPYRIDLLPPF